LIKISTWPSPSSTALLATARALDASQQQCGRPMTSHQLNACLDGDVDVEAGEISGAFSRNACGQQNFASEIHLFL
jgi:hypothetical protein